MSDNSNRPEDPDAQPPVPPVPPAPPAGGEPADPQTPGFEGPTPPAPPEQGDAAGAAAGYTAAQVGQPGGAPSDPQPPVDPAPSPPQQPAPPYAQSGGAQAGYGYPGGAPEGGAPYGGGAQYGSPGAPVPPPGSPYGTVGGPGSPQKGGKGLAVTALVLAIVGAILSFIPFAVFLGLVVVVVALVLSIVALVKKANGKGLSIAALIVSAVGTLVGIGMLILTLSIITFIGTASDELDGILEENPELFEEDYDPFEEDPGVSEPEGSGEDPIDGAQETPIADSGAIDPNDFSEIDAATWDAIAADAEEHLDEMVAVYAEVTQYDSATGEDTLRANVGATHPGSEYELDTNTVLIAGHNGEFDGIVAQDVLKIYAAINGAFEYESALGAPQTVPSLVVLGFEDVGYADLTADVQIGTPEWSGYGSMDLPITVTNSASSPMSYSIEVVAETPDGATQYDSGYARVSNLEPGQSATDEAMFFDVPEDATFRVVDVTRRAD